GAAGNGCNGIYIGSPGNTIGGTTPADRNIISANSMPAVAITDGWFSLTNDNVIQGNYIGTDSTGTQKQGPDGRSLGNLNVGIYVRSGANTRIGGTAGVSPDSCTGACNVIANTLVSAASGYLCAHQVALDRTSSDTRVEGNFIGTDVTGQAKHGNEACTGVLVLSDLNTIGGEEPGARNVIANSAGDGIGIVSASNNDVRG